jgi:predicted small metal-binding protein
LLAQDRRKTVDPRLYQLTCAPECGFSVKSRDRAEVVAHAILHNKRVHRLDKSEADVQKMIQEVPG